MKKKFPAYQQVEELKKEISKTESELLIKNNKNIRKSLKNHINARRKLANFINEED